MIHEEICTYEVAKLAKEKGFPQHIGNDAYVVENQYDDEYEVGCCYPMQFTPDYLPTITAPTQSLLQRWLREEKNIQIVIRPKLDKLGAWIWGHYRWTIFIFNEYRPTYYSIYNGDNSTYELALEDALAYSLKNLV
jgi:hypothetical protein